MYMIANAEEIHLAFFIFFHTFRTSQTNHVAPGTAHNQQHYAEDNRCHHLPKAAR